MEAFTFGKRASRSPEKYKDDWLEKKDKIVVAIKSKLKETNVLREVDQSPDSGEF